MEREYLTAIRIEKGIITLIQPDGGIGFYRQRGINQLGGDLIFKLLKGGYLDQNWKNVKELPKQWSISFEDEEIMGHAYATFQIPKKFKPKHKA